MQNKTCDYLSGCTLILKSMLPSTPARILQEKLTEGVCNKLCQGNQVSVDSLKANTAAIVNQ